MRRTRVAGGVGTALAVGAAAVLRTGRRKLACGSVTLNLGIGRSTRPLGPLTIRIDAPRETVFDVIAEPYLQRITGPWLPSSSFFSVVPTWCSPPTTRR